MTVTPCTDHRERERERERERQSEYYVLPTRPLINNNTFIATYQARGAETNVD